jgi:antitoxin MazE
MINKPKKYPTSQDTNKLRGKFKIEDLVAKLPSNYEVKELDWGKPLGLEVWM